MPELTHLFTVLGACAVKEPIKETVHLFAVFNKEEGDGLKEIENDQ